jgi:hypothetical protein
MENQHRSIAGYRELSQEEIDTMNDIKALAETVGRVVAALSSVATLDQRWVAVGKTPNPPRFN